MFSTTQNQSKHSLSFYLFYIAVVFIYLNFLRATLDERGEIFGSLARVFFIFIGPFFLFLTTFFALLEGQINRIKKKYQLWILCLIILFIFLIINGVIINQNSLRLIILDFIHYMFFLPAILIGSKKENWPPLDRLIRIIFLLNLVPCLFYIGAYDESLRRSEIILSFNQIPYFFYGQLALWPYLLLTINRESKFDNLIAIIGTAVYFYFSIVFLKRAPFVNFALFSVLVFFSYASLWRDFFKLRSLIIFTISILLFIGILAQTNYSILIERFTEMGDTVLSSLVHSNRISNDLGMLVDQFEAYEYPLGRGLGGVVIDYGNDYPEYYTSTLHNSSGQHFLKGGLIFLGVWTLGFLMITIDFIKKIYLKKSNNIAQHITIMLPFLFSWVFGFLSQTIFFLLVMLCVGRVISKETYSKF
jgi:hypothetical protein